MRGENGCDPLHPAHSLWEQSAVRYEDDRCAYRCQSYQELVREGECAFQQKTLPSPPEEKYTHTYTHGELPEAKAGTWDPRICTSTTGRWRNLQACTSFGGTGTFAKSNLKVNIHTCVYLKQATINRMFPLSNHHRKPHINKGV